MSLESKAFEFWSTNKTGIPIDECKGKKYYKRYGIRYCSQVLFNSEFKCEKMGENNVCEYHYKSGISENLDLFLTPEKETIIIAELVN